MYFRLKTGSLLSAFQIDISFLLDVSSLSRAHEDLSINVHASWYGSVYKTQLSQRTCPILATSLRDPWHCIVLMVYKSQQYK